MSVVVANGVKLHVQRLGDASAPPVVMLHGLMVGSLAQWYFTAAPALARRHGVLLYDLRGHGRSERAPTGYDLATMAADLAALTADYRPAPMTLVGHSFGALVALRFALDHPGRVGKIVLVEAPLPVSRFGQFTEFLQRAPEDMVAALPGPLQELLGRGSRQARRLVESLRFLAQDSTLLRDLEAEPDIPDAELATLAVPTLCVYGDQSLCREVGDRLARVIPGAELRVLRGGHYLHVDCARELTATLEAWIG